MMTRPHAQSRGETVVLGATLLLLLLTLLLVVPHRAPPRAAPRIHHRARGRLRPTGHGEDDDDDHDEAARRGREWRAWRERDVLDWPARMERCEGHPVYGGTLYLFRGPDLISDHVRKGLPWEPEMADAMVRWYRPGTDVCDVGANLGLSVLLLHLRLPPPGLAGGG